MLTPEARQELERQQYRLVGSHSAVKTCGWTKNMLRGRGGCYKLKFYGIMSHQCMQMTTSISCANRCVFCWRGYKAPVSKEWRWDVDDPEMILLESVKAHRKLLTGYGGNDKVLNQLYKQAQEAKHVALSLTGEPIIYPRINELIALFNQRGISTFMVTNAQYPEAIRDLAPVTQLYLSLDASTKELLKKIDVPLFSDYWDRLNQSLEYLSQKRQRTCIRLTAVKGFNMVDPEGYAKLILKGDPDFIEVKAYMFVGASRQRLSLENMPLHEEIVAFARELLEPLPDYELVAEHIPSRVVMLAKRCYKKNGNWHTWIDFEKYQKLTLRGTDFSTDDYSKLTPPSCVGISGRGAPSREEAVERKNRREARMARMRERLATGAASEDVEEIDLD